jgi:uncharacterized protein
MENLFIKHLKKISVVNLDYQREISERIDWNDRIIGIGGQRGVGKTTLLLQHIKKHYKTDKSVLYVSMDDLFFSANRLIDFAEQFTLLGGKCLFLDEIHRYPNWAQEIKNIYDDLPDLKVVFTGSSMLEISKSKTDLSRRVAYYTMPGMSLREYINHKHKKTYPILKLSDILLNHSEIAASLSTDFKPLEQFHEYFQHGYFPFYQESPKTFQQRIVEMINTTFDVDIMQLKSLNNTGLQKMKLLLYVIAQSVPFKPNIVKLSERIGVNRNTLLSYIRHLEDAGIITSLYASTEGIGLLQKPEKIYLENTCFNYALSSRTPEMGTLRETFFIVHLKGKHKLTYTNKGDFKVDSLQTFEIGGKGKGMQQLAGITNSWVAADNIEIGVNQKIPLWLFGFIY